MIKIKKGLDLPIAGAPEQAIDSGRPVRTVALVGFDYVGMKPTMEVKVGDRVKLGQLIFTDKKTAGVKYTAPASGVISAIHRGEKRVFQSIVIDVEGDDSVEFDSYQPNQLGQLEKEKVVSNLVESGLWTAFRTRPYSKVPVIDSTPHSIFVTAIDTNPLAADPQVVVSEYKEDFEYGLHVLGLLSDTKVHVCKAPGSNIPTPSDNNIQSTEFAGPHPAGLAGTHIHFLDPVSEKKTVWTVGYQDVIAIGKLFTTGQLWSERVVSLAGPSVTNPRLIRTRLGASTDEICAGEMSEGDNRVVSGSVLSGRTANGPLAYLGRYHTQVAVLQEGRERPMLHYFTPGVNRHSVMPIYLSKLMPSKLFSFTTSTNGSERAMVPIGSFEKIMPLDILPTQLLRALIVEDTDVASKLGCLELDEEDLALCTYVCSGKYEYGPILRNNLTRIEHEG